jgi:hypothetical protein
VREGLSLSLYRERRKRDTFLEEVSGYGEGEGPVNTYYQ